MWSEIHSESCSEQMTLKPHAYHFLPLWPRLLCSTCILPAAALASGHFNINNSLAVSTWQGT